LAIIIIGLTSILIVNKDIEISYGRSNDMAIMRMNAGNVLRQLDTSGIQNKEIFYLQKDVTNRRFLIHTGAIEDYRFIDRLGTPIARTAVDTKIYSRLFFIEKKKNLSQNETEVIRGSIRELLRK
jgi:hypothetical protein